jgi:hypothetical protein
LGKLLTPEKIAKAIIAYHIKNWQFSPKACFKTNRVLKQAQILSQKNFTGKIFNDILPENG